jgi:hypothetical protein
MKARKETAKAKVTGITGKEAPVEAWFLKYNGGAIKLTCESLPPEEIKLE